ncbi:DUF4260 domain-containing protein [Dokdonella sp.]|uniref:DUF4260 domain-containing protein n=1 Tax=Dokdonella sp. TaxID=2291710 RepID=UPI002F40E1BB
MSGAAQRGVRALLRVEGACVLFASTWLYAQSGYGWSVFALCFLAPDVAFLGYLAGRRIGAACYNATHAYVGPIACFVAGQLIGRPELFVAGLVWTAHVGFDRMLGYGLKYASGFGDTHLGPIGRGPRRAR